MKIIIEQVDSFVNYDPCKGCVFYDVCEETSVFPEVLGVDSCASKIFKMHKEYAPEEYTEKKRS